MGKSRHRRHDDYDDYDDYDNNRRAEKFKRRRQSRSKAIHDKQEVLDTYDPKADGYYEETQ